MKKIFDNLKWVLLIGLIIRILLAFSYDTGDTGAFCHASDLFIQGNEVYAAKDVWFSAPPFGLHVTAISNLIARVTGFPCSGMWKMPSILADIGIGYLIYLIAIRKFGKTKKQALTWTKWYIFNPIALYVSGFHGQQEAFWLFFVLLSWYLLSYRKTVFWGAISAAVALSYKLPTALLLPALLLAIKSFWKKTLFVIIIVIFFSFSLFPEIFTSTNALIRQSFLYSSLPGVWGITGIVNKLFSLIGAEKIAVSITANILKLALLVSIGGYYIKIFFKKKEKNFFKISLVVLTFFFVFTPGFSTQYLLWPLPFLILTSDPLLMLYTIVVTFGFLFTYGLGFAPLSLIVSFLETNVYYKLKLLYPYDLFYPTWILFIFMALGKENELLRFLRHTYLRSKKVVARFTK